MTTEDTEKKVRLSFVGAGGFATYAIYPAIHLVPSIDLVAVCDIDRAKAERNARNFGARQVYTDLEQMLEREKPDGVFCIGSAPQQYELAPHILRRGIPIYVEKPSAVTSQQARELAELAEAHGTWGQVGFMKRFADVYTMAKEIVAPDRRGRLRKRARQSNCGSNGACGHVIWRIKRLLRTTGYGRSDRSFRENRSGDGRLARHRSGHCDLRRDAESVAVAPGRRVRPVRGLGASWPLYCAA